MIRAERFLLFLYLLFSFFPLRFGELTLLKIFGFLFAGVALVSAISARHRRGVIDRFTSAIVVVWIAGILGGIGFGYVDRFSVSKMFLNVILFLACSHVIRKIDDLRVVFGALMAGGLLSIGSGLLEIGGLGPGGRAAGMLLNPNGFGQVCVQVGICALAPLALAKKVKTRTFFLLMLIPPIIGLAYSASRGASVALVGALACALILRRVRRASLAFGLLIAGMLTILAPFSLLEDRWERTLKRGKSESSAMEIRLGLAGNGVRIFKEYPVVGVGVGNVRMAVAGGTGMYSGGVTHNFLTQVLAETGILGTLPFLLVLAWTGSFLFWFARKKGIDRDSQILASTLLLLLVAVAVGQSLSGNYLHAIWYVIFGAAAGIRRGVQIQVATSWGYSAAVERHLRVA